MSSYSRYPAVLTRTACETRAARTSVPPVAFSYPWSPSKRPFVSSCALDSIEPGLRIEWPEITAYAHDVSLLLRGFAITPGSIVVGNTGLVPQQRLYIQHAERMPQLVTQSG